MKFSTLVMIGLLAMIAYGVNAGRWQLIHGRREYPEPPPTPAPTPAVVVAAPATPASTPPAPVVTVHATKLVMVKGFVTDVRSGHLMVDCKLSGSPYGQSAAAATNAMMVPLVPGQTEMDVFGGLRQVGPDGRLRDAVMTPLNRMNVTVALAGTPYRRGDVVNVLAAATGGQFEGAPEFTARFELQGGAWMWQGHSNPLNQNSHP